MHVPFTRVVLMWSMSSICIGPVVRGVRAQLSEPASLVAYELADMSAMMPIAAPHHSIGFK